MVLLWLAPAALAGIVLEILWYRLVQKRVYPWREMTNSLAIYGLRVPARLLAPLMVTPLTYAAWSHHARCRGKPRSHTYSGSECAW